MDMFGRFKIITEKQNNRMKPIHSKAIVSRLNLNVTVSRTIDSYAAANCHFRQPEDAHSQMALVIAQIWRAEARERGEHAQDHQCVNGEKLLMSSSSAECTEVEYATERYSGSPPPAPRQTRVVLRCGIGAGTCMHSAYKWSLILPATKL